MRACYRVLVLILCHLVNFTANGKDSYKGLSIATGYAPLWPHELPCYCYTNVVEVYKSTSEWIRSSTEFGPHAKGLTEEEAARLDMPNTTLFLPLHNPRGVVDTQMMGKHLIEGMRLSVADFDFGTSRLMRSDGTYIFVHKDFYCYLTLRGNSKRLEYENTDDKLANDILVLVPDIKTDNGFIHIISRNIP